MDKIYHSVVEALIFSSDDVLTAGEIIKAIKGIDGDDAQISLEEIDGCIDQLNDKYEAQNLSFRILRIANGYLFATTGEYSKYVGYLSSEKSKRRLSQAALETLSIVAYKQPITKPEIESIRGVNSDYILNPFLKKVSLQYRVELKLWADHCYTQQQQSS